MINSGVRRSKFLAAGAIVLALVLAGCGDARPKPLPKPLYWEGGAIWVPAHSAEAYSRAICEEGSYTISWPYHATPLPSGGELMTCDYGMKGF